MDEGSLSSITSLAVLMGIHALIALGYATVIGYAPSRQSDDDDEPPRSSRVLRLQDRLAALQMTTQLSLFLIRVAIIALATLSVHHPLLALPDQIRAVMVPAVSYAIVLVPLALLVYLLADVIPSTIGRSRANTLAPALAIPLHWLMVLFSPLVRLLLSVETTLARVSGGSNLPRSVTDKEILSLVDVGQLGGAIETEEKEMIRSVLEFGETLVRELMVPRLDLTALPIEATLDEALEAFVESGHSRVPVYEDTVDNIQGVLYAKDLLTYMHKGQLAQKRIAEIMRPAYFVPETKPADALFREMQTSKVHLAIVIDEYGGTAGLATIEDLVEEIVGDIQDEYDLNEVEEYVQDNEFEFTFDAGINLDDFNDLMHAALSTEDNDTLGGYIYDRLGRVPEPGETIDVDEDDSKLILRVDSVDGRRIRKVHATRVQSSPPDGGPDSNREDDAETAAEAAEQADRSLTREMSPKAAPP